MFSVHGMLASGNCCKLRLLHERGNYPALGRWRERMRAQPRWCALPSR